MKATTLGPIAVIFYDPKHIKTGRNGPHIPIFKNFVFFVNPFPVGRTYMSTFFKNFPANNFLVVTIEDKTFWGVDLGALERRQTRGEVEAVESRGRKAGKGLFSFF